MILGCVQGTHPFYTLIRSTEKNVDIYINNKYNNYVRLCAILVFFN